VRGIVRSLDALLFTLVFIFILLEGSECWGARGGTCGTEGVAEGLMLLFINYELLIERLARQWVAYSARHYAKYGRTRRADTQACCLGVHVGNYLQCYAYGGSRAIRNRKVIN
jgi:hypothetical protein